MTFESMAEIFKLGLMSGFSLVLVVGGVTVFCGVLIDVFRDSAG